MVSYLALFLLVVEQIQIQEKMEALVFLVPLAHQVVVEYQAEEVYQVVEEFLAEAVYQAVEEYLVVVELLVEVE